MILFLNLHTKKNSQPHLSETFFLCRCRVKEWDQRDEPPSHANTRKHHTGGVCKVISLQRFFPFTGMFMD